MDPGFPSDRRNRIGGMCVQGTQEVMKRRVENVKNILAENKPEGHELDVEEASDKPHQGHDREGNL
jgi:hypothetical protein